MKCNPPRSRTNLFVHKDRSVYSAISELCSNLPANEYRIAPDGIYLPLDTFTAWRDDRVVEQGGSWSDEELLRICAPGSEVNLRLARVHLMKEEE